MLAPMPGDTTHNPPGMTLPLGQRDFVPYLTALAGKSVKCYHHLISFPVYLLGWF